MPCVRCIRPLLRLGAVTAAVGAATPGHAQRAPLRLEDLAAAWSGTRAAPTCRPAPDDPELPDTLRAATCTWPPPAGSRDASTLTGRQAVGGALWELRWERAVAGPAAADRFADSLDTALHARGIQGVSCPAGHWLWERSEGESKFIVHLASGAPAPDGRLRVAVLATTQPFARIHAPATLPCYPLPPSLPPLPPPPAGARPPNEALQHSGPPGRPTAPLRTVSPRL